MEDNKLNEIIKNQHILNYKLDMIIYTLERNKIITNCQMFIQGITLADITTVDEDEKNKR